MKNILALVDVIVIWFAAVNVILFILMYQDKRFARRRFRRIPEKVLLLLGLLGGGIGGLLGMKVFRHKTKHLYFFWLYLIASIFWLWLIMSQI